MDRSPYSNDELFDVFDLKADGLRSPQFCRRCRTEIDDPQIELCEECGDSLQKQGYCPICESFVLQQPGEFCRKHDVPLEAGDPSIFLDRLADGTREWVTLETYLDRSRAEGLRIRLEAEGIPTFVDGERMGSMSMYQVATGGVRLQVPRELVDDARIILSQSWTAPEVGGDDLEDAWDDLAPEPGQTRRFVMKGFILYSLFAPAILYPLILLISAWIRWKVPGPPGP
jgi:hypothetical protein